MSGKLHDDNMREMAEYAAARKRELLVHCIQCDRGFPVKPGQVIIIGFWKCDDCLAAAADPERSNR